jgi:hypothetical protein
MTVIMFVVQFCFYSFSIVNFKVKVKKSLKIPKGNRNRKIEEEQTPQWPGVYISQLKRYSWACAQYIDFLDRYQLLTQKLLKQDYVKKSLKIPKGNRNRKIEEEQTPQWPKEKVQKRTNNDLQNIHIKLKIE